MGKILDMYGRKIRPKNEGFTAASSKRSLAGWLYDDSDSDSTSAYDLARLRGRSRDLYRNTPAATSAVNRNVDNVLGSGLILQAQVNRDILGLSDDEADAWETDVENRFDAWASSNLCDLTEHENFYDLQSQAYRAMLLSGDSFTLPVIKANPNLYGELRLAVYEGDYVCNPGGGMDTEKLVQGIELGADSNPIAYHFANKHPNGRYLPTAWERVNKYGTRSKRLQCIHLFERKRPGQHRGIPFLTPVIDSIKQLGRYTEAEITAAVISAFFTVFIKQNPNKSGDIFEQGVPEAQRVSSDSSTYEMGNGNIVGLDPNEEPVFADPKRPNPVFDSFSQAFSKIIGSALDIPGEVISMQFNSSYSAARAALLQAWTTFRKRRTFDARYWCNPIYELWLELEVINSRVKAPGYLDNPLLRKAWAGSDWVGPGMGMIDPVRETTAALLRIAGKLSNHEKEFTKIDGGDWLGTAKVLARENKTLTKIGLAGGPDMEGLIQLATEISKTNLDQGGNA